MRKLLVIIFLAILGIALIIFFVANRQDVLISFDPTSLDNPAIALGPMPMWGALAGTLFIGYGLGAIGMWFSNSALRTKAKERNREVKRLKNELKFGQNAAPTESDSKQLALRK